MIKITLCCSLRHLSGLLLLSATMAVYANPPREDMLLVEKVVMLIRHGETSIEWVEPIASTSDRTMGAGERFNSELTAHGRTALVMWGQFQRNRLQAQGVLPSVMPLNAGHLEAFASPPLRTRASADAFLEGFGGGQINVTHDATQLWYDLRMIQLPATRVSLLQQAVARNGNVGVLIDLHGALLLQRLAESLLSEITPEQPSVSLFMGHDANLTALRSLIGFDWHAPQRLPNIVDAAGSLIFERMRCLQTNQRYVRISYMAPNRRQALYLEMPGGFTPPFTAVFHPEAPTFRSPGANLIPLDVFDGLVDLTLTQAEVPHALRTATRQHRQQVQTRAALSHVPAVTHVVPPPLRRGVSPPAASFGSFGPFGPADRPTLALWRTWGLDRPPGNPASVATWQAPPIQDNWGADITSPFGS